MSRLCIKNVPSVSESKLKETFSQIGEVTDVKIVKSSKGKSRGIAFIGFRNNDQAIKAQNYFNGTYIGTSRITVEIAKKFGDIELIENSKSKHSKKKLLIQSTQKAELCQVSKVDGSATKKVNERSEFLEIMKPRHLAKKWSNDEALSTNEHTETLFDASDDSVSYDNDPSHDLLSKSSLGEEVGVVSGDSAEKKSSVRSAHVAPTSPSSIDIDFLRSKIKSDFSDSDDSDSDSEKGKKLHVSRHKHAMSSSAGLKQIRDHNNSKNKIQTYTVSDDNEVREFEPKLVASETLSQNLSDFNQDESDQLGQNEYTDNDKELMQASDDVKCQSGRLFVRNLPFDCTEEELNELFSGYGPISEIHIPLAVDSEHSRISGSSQTHFDQQKRGKGFGFVQFMIPEHALNAWSAIDGASFQGRLLHIIPAKDKNSDDTEGDKKEGENSHSSEFKRKKEKERRSVAGLKDSWNASYIRSDAVVASLAEKYGLTKGQVMDTNESAGELAVRMAIGEAQVVKDNIAYLASHGVNLAVLESHNSKDRASKRSNTTLLVKNLPHDTVSSELLKMFSKFGPIGNFILPPSKTVALIEYVEPVEARNAFKNLAYKKFMHLPLYLEWAPLDIIDKNKIAKSSTSFNESEQSNATSVKTKEADDMDDEIIEDTGNTYSTLYVKNLSFQTTEASLTNHLSDMGALSGFRCLSIPEKVSKYKGGSNRLSMGFGFIEYMSLQCAQDALRRIHESLLDGHTLDIKPSQKRVSIANRPNLISTKQKSSSKLLVKNIAFQATKSELKALFSTYGTVKRVRIPKKLGNTHRGFAFVDMSSAQEALNAMDSLRHTHFYGRHLIIEAAKQDEDDEEFEGAKQEYGIAGVTNSSMSSQNNKVNSFDGIHNVEKMKDLRKRARKDERIVSRLGEQHGKRVRTDQFNDVPSMSDHI